MGRFLIPDTLTGELTDPLSQNLYVYCGNNPVLYIDPSGQIKICQLYDLGSGLWDSGAETLRELKYLPGALWDLSKAVYNRELSWNDLILAVRSTGSEIAGTVGYVWENSNSVWFGNPSNEEVYEYGRNLGNVSQMAVGGGGTLKPFFKVVPKTVGVLEKTVVNGAGNAATELRRPYIRNSVRQEVEANAPRTTDGRFIDPNTGLSIEGKYDLGHKPGNEFWREKAKAQSEGLTQKEFKDRMNSPGYYQIEDPISNRSHKYEMPK